MKYRYSLLQQTAARAKQRGRHAEGTMEHKLMEMLRQNQNGGNFILLWVKGLYHLHGYM